MQVVALMPSKSAFMVASSPHEFEQEIKPLLVILEKQHPGVDSNLFLSSEEEVKKDHDTYLALLKNPEFNLRLCLRRYYDIEARDYEYFFLVNRTLTCCFSLGWDYPALKIWGDHSPFFASDPLKINSLLELSSAPMCYAGKALLETTPLKVNELSEEEKYAKYTEQIEVEKKRGLKDELILNGLLGLYQKDLISDELYNSLHVYLGYDVGDEWNASSLPKRKVMLPTSLGGNDWSHEKHYSLMEAKAFIKESKEENLSDIFIRNTSIDDYLRGAIDFASLKIICHLLKMDLDPSLSENDLSQLYKTLETLIY